MIAWSDPVTVRPAVDLKWGFGIEYINIRMSEEEFKNNKY